MDVVRLLSDFIANQIAAGEVIQRPASVVKELLENAIDAGSTSITLKVKDGGRELIHIMDNGCGMSPQDARTAFKRHATSKISDSRDLYNISTFGFRGEALPSISSVAEVELRTRRQEDETGIRLSLSGGEITASGEINTPKGSQFIIKNLFYNIPARRKFLKSNSVEMRHIISEFTRVALCNPETEMTLYNGESVLYNLPSSNLRQRIVSVMGKGVNSSLLELSVDTSIIRIGGFIGHPQSAKKSGTNEQYLFVNNRYFKSPYFHKAVVSAYEKLIRDEVQPAYFLYFSIDPSRIDVNIHPSKTEIKFEDEQAIWQIINAAVRESLGKLGAVPLMDFDTDTSIEIPVFREGFAKMPSSHLNPDFNPFSQGESTKYRDGNRHIKESVIPEEWGILYENDYDSFDKSSTPGETFRSFITEEERESEEVEFISAGFSGASYAEELSGDGYTGETQQEEDEQFLEIESSIGGEVQASLTLPGLSPESGFIRIGSGRVVARTEQGVAVIDLRRAHHRVLYERFLYTEEHSASVNQQDMFPEPVELSKEDILLLNEAREELLYLGFDMREGEGETMMLCGIPADITKTLPSVMIASLLDALREESGRGALDKKRRIARAMADTYSLGRSRALQDDEIKELLRSFFECREPSFTCTGLPTITIITQEEISKRLS